MTTKKWKTSGKDCDVLTTERYVDNNSVLFIINSYAHTDIANSLVLGTHAAISDEERSQGYTQGWTTQTIVDTPYLVVLRPLEGSAGSLAVNKTLEIGDSALDLHAVVVYNGHRHYVCYFRWKNVWYFYNDAKRGELYRIGSFEDLMERSELNPQKLGVLFFYSVRLQ